VSGPGLRDRRTERSRLDGRRVLVLVCVLILLGALTLWRPGNSSRDSGALFEVSGATMGTTFRILVDAPVSPEQADRIRALVRARLDRVDDLMSAYDSASEVSRFNRHRSTAPFSLSAEVIEVLSLAAAVSEASDGAFDVTVASLVDAWGFGPEERRSGTPDEEEVQARVDFRQIEVDPVSGTAAKTDPRVTVDLSGIGKGYGVELVAEGLRELGFPSFLVEVGGELKAGQRKRDGTPWRVAIEKPVEGIRSVYGIVALVDEAIATSGDYRRFQDTDSVRWSHLIDPDEGLPVRFRGASVTVLHENAARADAWATALAVRSPDEAYALAVREGIAAVFVHEDAGAFRSRMSPVFAERRQALEELDES